MSTRQDKWPRLAGAGRYELRSVLGGGRTGLVHEAYDRELGRTVALKTLRTLEPEALYRLKREFRTLARLAHSNLVPFFDLYVEDDECFFTMKLIEGENFVEHFQDSLLRAGSNEGAYAALRDAIAQLAAGLEALHGHGILHRDVKAANVLIESSGRLVLLDLGLSVPIPARDEDAPATAGTMGFLAPEQITGRGASPASDWYSAGVMLYEALTGRLPFEGPALLAALVGRATEPVPPRALEPRTPAELDALVLALLHPEPERRPRADEVVALLAGAPQPARAETSEPDPHAPRSLFVGRHAELAELVTALRASRSALCTVEIRGASGIGKSALLEEFATRARRGARALVLGARCHPQEEIPFKAMDGVIDDLARALADLPDDAVARLLPDEIAAARRIFPVLGRVPRIARANDPGGADVDPMHDRRRAFAALRTLLARLAAQQPLVLWIDDLQWGDLDSVALLRELRRVPDPPALLLLLAYRSEANASAHFVDALRAGGAGHGPTHERTIELGPLRQGDAQRLVVALLAGGDGGDATQADVIATESQGSPLFAVELARHVVARRRSGVAPGEPRPLGISEVVAARVDGLPPLARELLELVAVAGRPLERELERHPRLQSIDLRPALALLRAQCLVRAVPFADGVATEAYHDRIRETVLALLPEAVRRTLHRELAAALEAQPDADPRLLVEHYQQAGETARAGELAVASGRRAAAALAFNQAAELYMRGLELGATSVPRWLLEARIGTMLTYAGRGGEGAVHYDAAERALTAVQPDDARRIGLRRRAAELYLRSGLYEQGLVALRQALHEAGVRWPRSPFAALGSVLLHRLRLRLRRALASAAKTTTSDADRERLELYWSAGVGLSLFDLIRATDFQLRHALLALRVGEPRHRARALATEALTLAWEGGSRNRRRSEIIQREAVHFAASVGDPRIVVQTITARAAIAFVERRYREALALCEEGARLSHDRHVGTTWEIANLDLCAVSVLACVGDLAQLRERLVKLQQQAHERGDLYSAISLCIGFPNLGWLGGDDPGEARRQIASARHAARLAPFQEYCAVFAAAQVDLYDGDARAAWSRTTAAWPESRRNFLLRVQGIRCDHIEIRARSALAVVANARPGHERQRLLRFADRAARRLGREDVAWMAPSIAALRAGVAWQRGERADSVVLLEEAARGFDALDMRAHAAAARLHLARVGIGATVERCSEVMRALGVVDPARFAAMLVPGIVESAR